MQIKAALVDAVKNRQAVLFAGAGISWKAIGFGGLYIRDQLGMQIKRDYPTYEYESRSLEAVGRPLSSVVSQDSSMIEVPT